MPFNIAGSCGLLLCETCKHCSLLAVPAGPAPAKSADVYANNDLKPKRTWPSGSPKNPFTQVIYWQRAPYARLKKDGWMRIYGMQSGKGGKVQLIMESRGGNQYSLEVPLRQVRVLTGRMTDDIRLTDEDAKFSLFEHNFWAQCLKR